MGTQEQPNKTFLFKWMIYRNMPMRYVMVKLIANPDSGCVAVSNLLFLVAFANYRVFGFENPLHRQLDAKQWKRWARARCVCVQDLLIRKR